MEQNNKPVKQEPVFIPEFPEIFSLADIGYAQHEKPDGWDDGHFKTWQDLQVCTRNKMLWYKYAKELRKLLINLKPVKQEPVACPDKGLWTVKQWGTDKVVLLSGDFAHDVALAISGDFLDSEQRLDYALNLATWMNCHLQNASPVKQAEQEPVAWLYDWEREGEIVTGWVTQDFETTKFNNGHNVRPLYTHPVRTKDLTDDEIHELVLTWENHALARAVIAADREKNK